MIKKIMILFTLIFSLLIQPTQIDASQSENVFLEEYAKNGVIYDIYSDHAEVAWYSGEDTKVVILESVKNKTVTLIKNEAFFSCEDLKTIEIPETVTSIGEYSFYGCIRLENINIPENVNYIGEGAFYLCKMLRKVDLPTKLTKIERYTFGENKFLKEINIPEGVLEIDDWAFSFCTMLSNVKLPASLEKIGNRVFFYCNSLEQIDIPTSVKRIGGLSFSSTPWLLNKSEEFVIVGDGVLLKYNGDSEIVKIPENVKCISGFEGDPMEDMDYFNKRMKTVIIPESVMVIEDWAFFSNIHFESIVIPGNVESIGEYAFQWTGLKNVEIEDGVKNIGNYAFSGCMALERISIPDSVEFIGKNAFSDNYNLKDVQYNSGTYAEEYFINGHGNSYMIE